MILINFRPDNCGSGRLFDLKIKNRFFFKKRRNGGDGGAPVSAC